MPAMPSPYPPSGRLDELEEVTPLPSTLMFLQTLPPPTCASGQNRNRQPAFGLTTVEL
jgi:hypothetical protein